MVRSWGLVVLSGAAQPWFGDVTTAAVAAMPDGGIIPVTVGSTTRYRVGDRIYIEPDTANQDMLMIDGIPSSTVLNCRLEGGGKTHAHANTSIIQLSIPAMDVIIQSNAAASVWLGSDNTVATAGGGSSFYRLDATPSTPFRLAGSIGGANTCRTSDGWMIGTSTQGVLVSAIVL